MTDTPGLVIRVSRFSHEYTLERLTAAIRAHSATLFDVIDHAGHAARDGLELPPTTVVIFGNPAVGTPLMVAAPDLALDLPSRVLVRTSITGIVEVVYRDPASMAGQHGLGEESMAGLTGLVRIIDDALKYD